MARAARRSREDPGPIPSSTDLELRSHVESRLMGLRVNRYSWWTHARELADYLLPRRYKWLITPNAQSRGSPINQHILDSTGTLAARNLGAGIMWGTCDPATRWFKLRIGNIDSTQTSPVSLWLAECERLMFAVFQESNFYQAIATMLFDLVIFGTGVMLIYEDFENVISCINPCYGEFYLDVDPNFFPTVLYREFTMTVPQVVKEFGVENVSPATRRLYNQGKASWTREIVVAHALEPNDLAEKYGIPKSFKYREVYWEWGGSASPQGGSAFSPGLLRKRGYHESPFIGPRWDTVSNDAYGRGPGMDALPDVKQLQLEVKRKAQAIDKLVNPPMVADIQLKNQPASLLPGGVTYVAGVMSNSRPGFAPVYQVQPPVKEIMEDLNEVRERIKEIFFNNLFRTISQYETRSNVSATEIDARRAESMLMLGPVLNRLYFEGYKPGTERVFAMMSRAGIFPPAPQEVQGREMSIDFVSMLEIAQTASQAGGIERLFSLAGNLAAVDPAVLDNIDLDYGLDKYSSLLNNDPKLIRSPAQLAQIRKSRADQQQKQQQIEQAGQLAQGAATLSKADVGGGQNALQALTQKAA